MNFYLNKKIFFQEITNFTIIFDVTKYPVDFDENNSWDFFDLDNMDKNPKKSNNPDNLKYLKLNPYNTVFIKSSNKYIRMIMGGITYVLSNNSIYFPIFPSYHHVSIKLEPGVRIYFNPNYLDNNSLDNNSLDNNSLDTCEKSNLVDNSKFNPMVKPLHMLLCAYNMILSGMNVVHDYDNYKLVKGDMVIIHGMIGHITNDENYQHYSIYDWANKIIEPEKFYHFIECAMKKYYKDKKIILYEIESYDYYIQYDYISDGKKLSTM
jgi:hypothetical protein